MGCPHTTDAKKKEREKEKTDAGALKDQERCKVTRKQSARDIQSVIAYYPSIRLKYKLLDIVGHGRFGVVYKAESISCPDQKVAVKIMKIVNPEEKRRMLNEARILKVLDHPNIVKYYEEIEDGPYIFIVTEFCSGGEILDRISKMKTTCGESDVAIVIEKLLRALSHCHAKNIAHRDIKPENIMYASEDPSAEIKLIDFGFAKTETKQEFQTMLGSPNFVAPEVIEGSYTKACDVWSVGVVLYLLLSGHQPFGGKTIQEVLRNVQNAKITMDQPEWKKVTPPGQELVRKLLEPDTKKRPSAAEALNHPWFKAVKFYPPQVDELDGKIADSLKRYKGTSRLQKELLNIAVKNMKEKDIEHLITAYRSLDADGTGYISCDDLLKAFAKDFPDTDVKLLVSQMDIHGCGKINYSQFIAATMNVQNFLTHEKMWALFRYFDEKQEGFITAKDIAKVLNYTAVKEHGVVEVEAMLKEHGIEGSGSISFVTFCEIMRERSLEPKEDILVKVLEEKQS